MEDQYYNLKAFWVSTAAAASLLFHISIASGTIGIKAVGVCYGISENSSTGPSAGEVVSMFVSNKIKMVRLYHPDHSMLHHLRGTRIQVSVGVKNGDIPSLAESYNASHDWVETNLGLYRRSIRFRYLVVGNEVVPATEYAPYLLQTMKNLYKALKHLGLEKSIKISTAVSTSHVLGPVKNLPSAAAFSKYSEEYMVPIVRYLHYLKSPLLANIHPYFIFTRDPVKISLGYALFHAPRPGVKDGNFSYQSLFDEMVDALYVSLEKAGQPRVPIVVSETGWPWKGNTAAARPEIAQEYNSKAVKHVLSSRGTPRRAGKVETYLFAMFDEEKRLAAGTSVETHWGLFHSTKIPVYPLSFIR